MTLIWLSGIWTAGLFAAAARPLAAATLVDLPTALLEASSCDIEAQGLDPTSGRVKPLHEHGLPDDVTALVDTSRAQYQWWVSDVVGRLRPSGRSVRTAADGRSTPTRRPAR